MKIVTKRSINGDKILNKSSTETIICVHNYTLINNDRIVVGAYELIMPIINGAKMTMGEIIFNLTPCTLFLLTNIIEKCIESATKKCEKCNVANRCEECLNNIIKLKIYSSILYDEDESVSKSSGLITIFTKTNSFHNKRILPLTENFKLKDMYMKACIDYGLMGYLDWQRKRNHTKCDDETLHYIIIIICGTTYKKKRSYIKYYIDYEKLQDVRIKSSIKFKHLFKSYFKLNKSNIIKE